METLSATRQGTVPLLACKQCPTRFALPKTTPRTALLACKQWHTFYQHRLWIDGSKEAGNHLLTSSVQKRCDG
jgi:hypothetical protein